MALSVKRTVASHDNRHTHYFNSCDDDLDHYFGCVISFFDVMNLYSGNVFFLYRIGAGVDGVSGPGHSNQSVELFNSLDFCQC